MIELRAVKGIIFDLDGTLYKMRWFLKPLLTIKVFPHCMRLPHFLKIRAKYAGIDLHTRENLLKEICSELAKKENLSVEAIQTWVSNSFYPGFISTMKFQRGARPGLNLTLKKLYDARIKLGVLSDYDNVLPRLDELKIDSKHFSVMASCEASGALKPSSRPFLNIAHEWNIEPQHIVVIGDRDDTDGVAALNAGMQFVKIYDSQSKSTTNGISWIFLRKLLSEISDGVPHS